MLNDPHLPLIRKVLKLLIGMVVIAVLVGILANLLGTPQGPLQITLFACLFVAALIAYIALEFADQTREKNESLVQRNRRRMLEKVWNFWIDGVLNQSLYHVARLELGLVEQPDAIEHPWKLVVQQPERAPRLLSDGMPMHKVFEQFDKTLLLLGAPGSGKTTLLLELARDLIKRAEKDPAHPIPVVFNLSSWGLRRSSVMEWLVDELNERYDVPRKIGQHWVDNQQVLPLLDGLDEVAGEHRAGCVEAINAFRKQYGLLPLVVCSRVADYEALTARLRLPGAVTIQPLTQAQIEVYMEQGGKSLEQVRTLLDQDPTLWELLDTPLMISIMRLAFQGQSEAVMSLDAGAPEERRGQLFDKYIRAMFTRRKTASPYAPKQIRHWLTWLAYSMVHRNQTIFYLEHMQSDWLPKTHARIQIIGSSLVVGLIGGLYGIGFGLVTEQVAESETDRQIVLFTVLTFGLIFGLIFGLGFGLNRKGRIRPTEEIRWPWKKTRRLLLYGLVVGPVFGLISWWVNADLVKALEMMFGVLVIVVYIGLFALLIFDLVEKEITTRTIPNEGIRRSLRNALVVGPVGWLYFTLPFYGVASDPLELFVMLSQFLFIGLSLGLSKGGYACIQHGLLRVLLWRNDFAPLNYVCFLDEVVKYIFLRRVGGGYIFVHRLVMEHFARLELEGSKSHS